MKRRFEHQSSAGPEQETKSTAHTPGPWKITRSYPRKLPFGVAQDKPEARECKTVLTGNAFARATSTEAEANAHLIAAAPDLLEALDELRKRAVILSDELHDFEGLGGELPEKVDRAWGVLSMAIENSFDAITKAKANFSDSVEGN